ncbi:MAG: hypothetical protein ACK481_05840 [Candidatus Melainabacteria bacterium]|jgi:hypothetical protein
MALPFWPMQVPDVGGTKGGISQLAEAQLSSLRQHTSHDLEEPVIQSAEGPTVCPGPTPAPGELPGPAPPPQAAGFAQIPPPISTSPGGHEYAFCIEAFCQKQNKPKNNTKIKT